MRFANGHIPNQNRFHVNQKRESDVEASQQPQPAIYELLTQEGCRMSKQVVYQVPPANSLDECAREICETLSKSLSVDYSAPEVVASFTEHLRVIAAIAVKQMNQEQSASSAKDLSRPVDNLEQKS
jgi:arginyl-tRNA--protein-N-Asp/Glu arginylyltransferase